MATVKGLLTSLMAGKLRFKFSLAQTSLSSCTAVGEKSLYSPVIGNIEACIQSQLRSPSW